MAGMALQPILQPVASFLGRQSIAAARNYTIKYGPSVAYAGQLFVEASDEARDFVKQAAIANEDPLTADEMRILEEDEEVEEVEDIEGFGFAIDENGEVIMKKREKRDIRVCCQTIRASRDGILVEAMGLDKSPIPLLSHWSLEIGGNYYELRAHDPTKPLSHDLPIAKASGRTILYQELGSEQRKIKLEISTDRHIHESAKYFTVGTTHLSDEKILWAASIIFARFSSSYELLVDNCQHFSQLLAETITPADSRAEVRKYFDSRSFLQWSAAASYVVAPFYGATKVLHHAMLRNELYPKEGDEEKLKKSAIWKVNAMLVGMENYYWHPRVYARRRRLNPFS